MFTNGLTVVALVAQKAVGRLDEINCNVALTRLPIGLYAHLEATDKSERVFISINFLSKCFFLFVSSTWCFPIK